MFEFDCLRPRDVGEALADLARCGERAAVLAGGTDLHVLMRAGLRGPAALVSIGAIPALRQVEEHDDTFRLGAAVAHATVASHPCLERFRALTLAASAIGSPQVRNVGTVGGNIANASPAGDLYPPLLAFGARVELAGPGGCREVGLDDFVLGPNATSIGPGELVTGVVFDAPAAGFYSGFAKVGLRNAVAISVANCAIVAHLRDGKLADVRIACGAIAPRPIRMRAAEAVLEGQPFADGIAEEAGRAASAECDPITDLRASAAYRRHVAGVLVARLARAAWRDLAGERE